MEHNGEFKGSTLQALNDIRHRLDRVEDKLDRVIEKNIFVATIVSGVTGILIAIISTVIN